jgi:ParB-like chromosome segregation protein Spo0J
MTKHPVDDIEWIDRNDLRPNNYNPNVQARPEFDLLMTSILEDGWTCPLVIHRESMTIIDGEHRWRASECPELQAMTEGMVPVTFITGNPMQLMAATIRHNRARGVHGVQPMSAIVRQLHEAGWTDGQIMRCLGMEDEEVRRLRDHGGSPRELSAKDRLFSRAWKPDRNLR